jgi:hypothetical protein
MWLAYLSIMDEFQAGNGADCLRDFLEERVALDLACCAETGSDGIKCRIVVAGVADKLPCAFGHGVKNFA